MKRLLTILLILVAFIGNAQDSSPLPNINVVKLIAPNNTVFYYNTLTHDFWVFMGQYGWKRLAGYSDIQNNSGSVTELYFSGTNTKMLTLKQTNGGDKTASFTDFDNQNLSTNGNPGNVFISGGNSINLNVNDADHDTTNELITFMQVQNDSLKIVEAGILHKVKILTSNPYITDSAYIKNHIRSDLDTDPTNELQDTTSIPGLLKFIQDHAPTSDLSPYQLKSDTTSYDASKHWVLNQGFIKNYTETDPIFNAWDKDYNDLTNKPTIPAAQIQSDWNQTNTSSLDYIKNKPSIPAGQIQSDWNQSNSGSVDYIKNKPTIPTVSAGNGMSFSNNAPVTLGTPSTIDYTTDNEVTGNSHTHKLGEIDVSKIIKIGNFGALYNRFAALDSRKITSSDNWIIPTKAIVDGLCAYVGGIQDGDIWQLAGNHLKESGLTHWETTTPDVIDDYGFSMIGNGFRVGYSEIESFKGLFSGIKDSGNFWISDENTNPEQGYQCDTDDLVGDINIVNNYKKDGRGIRLCNPNTTHPEGTSWTYIGNDGTEYITIVINGVEWTTLINEKKFRNGDWIHGYEDGFYHKISNLDWSSLSTDGMCYYNDDELLSANTGSLSNILLNWEHNKLQSIQGGSSENNEFYHLTEAEKNKIHSPVTINPTSSGIANIDENQVLTINDNQASINDTLALYVKKIALADSLINYISKTDTSSYVSTRHWTNTQGFLKTYTETDPTLYSWAKAATKPSYTYSEVGAQAPLVSGTNIKTVNGSSLLGSGDLTISGSSHDPVSLGSPANGLSLSTQQLSLGLSSGSTTGALSSTDWTTFNAKQTALVSGTNIKTVNGNSLLGSGDLTITGGGTSTPTIWTALTGTYASATTFTFAGTDTDAKMVELSLLTCTNSTGATRRIGYIKTATNNSGTISCTVVTDTDLASGDKDFKVAYNQKVTNFLYSISTTGECIADASYSQGMVYQDFQVASYLLPVDASVITPAAGTGAALTWNIYKGSTNLFSSAPDMSTNSVLRSQRPTTNTISAADNVSMRILSSAGATNKAASLQLKLYIVPQNLYTAF